MAMTILPAGLKGILVASMLAAFMSTFSSLLNWGSSYFVNDLYRRFLVKNRSSRHYLLAGQMAMIPMTLIAALIAFKADSVLQLLFYVGLASAGLSTPGIAQWLWWRMNAWSQIAGLIGSLVIGMSIAIFIPDWISKDNLELYFGHRMFVGTLGTLVIWLIVTYLTPADDPKRLDDFYRKLRPPGLWGPVRKRLGMISLYSFKSVMYGWIVMILAIYCPLAGLLKFVFNQKTFGLILLAIGAVAIVLAIRKARKEDDIPETEGGV